MTIRTIMVSLDLGPNAGDRVKLAADLADRFDATLIGAAARKIDYFSIDPAGLRSNSPVIAEEERRIAADLDKAEQLFRGGAGSYGRLEWRSGVGLPGRFLAEHARAADLVVVAQNCDHERWGAHFFIDAGEAALVTGRPVLVVPPGIRHLSARRVVVAWKDVPEARRAVKDALPLLRKAEEVVVLTVGEGADGEGARDVARYLQRANVAAGPVFRQGSETAAAAHVLEEAAKCRADLIVAGAYGRSRMRELLFGGVTHELLHKAPLCCLMAH